jgi:hypothetical protein
MYAPYIFYTCYLILTLQPQPQAMEVELQKLWYAKFSYDFFFQCTSLLTFLVLHLDLHSYSEKIKYYRLENRFSFLRSFYIIPNNNQFDVDTSFHEHLVPYEGYPTLR